MALRTPYDFEQDPTDHPRGERQISVADPLGSAQGAHTFYLSRRFNFDEGDYTFITTADDAATVWIGTALMNSRIIASPTLTAPSIVEVHIPQGAYRIDVMLTNTPVDPTPCYFTMLIMRGEELIYASTKEGWNLDDAAISDDDLPVAEDYRFSLPVWSLLPTWKDGVTERLSWFTDVIASEKDAEQRRSVRRNARRSFEASFLRQHSQRSRMDAFFTGVGTSQFLVPLWYDQVKMLDGIDMEASGVAFPDGDLHMREFRRGDLVFVNNGDPDDYDILQVGDVEEKRFSWAFPPPRAWPVGTRIFPLRVARIYSQSPKMSNVTDTVSRAQILFDLVEPYRIEPSWGAQIGGEPLFRFEVDRANPIDVSFDRKTYVLDNTSGVPGVVDHGRYTNTVLQARLRLFGRGTAYRFRQFLQAARGRARHFYAPTFMQDIDLFGDMSGDATVNELAVKPQGFRKAMLRPQPIRMQLAFQFRNDSPTLYRTITDVKEVRDGAFALVSELLVLDAPMPAIRLSELKRISFMCETRFEQDTFEIHHPTTGQAMIEVAIVMRQAYNQRTTA